MKKSKIMLSTLAAAVFATSAGALVACGEDIQLPDGLANKGMVEITFSANGGMFADNTATKTVKTDLNGLISLQPETPTRPNWTFTGYYLEQDSDGETKITYGTDGYKFTTAITVYAHWKENAENPPETTEYKVTFNVGTNGACATTELTTVNGKITLPAVTANNGYTFKGWYTQATGGEKVENDKVYTGATSLYAQYEQVQQGGSEYTITLDVGDHGSYGATTLTTTDGRLAGLTDATADSGWTFEGWYTAPNGGGSLVTPNYAFTGNGTIYAYYTEAQTNPNVDPEPPARIYSSVTINGVAMDDTTDTIDRTWVEYPDYQGYQNHTLADQFETYLTVTTETTYTLKAGDTPISTLWIQHPESDGIQVKAGDMFIPAKTDEGNEGLNGSSFTLVEGEYSVYLKVYADGGRCIWITGTMDGEFQGGEERPATDPNPPASTVAAATINSTAMDREAINRNWTADATNPDGGYYNNHTMTDQFKAELTVTEVTTYTFKADGTNISGMWIEFAEGLEIKIDGTIATRNNNGNSITLAAGTYKIYLKKYVEAGNFCLWVEGTKTGEWGNGGGGEERPDTDPNPPAKAVQTATINDTEMEEAEIDRAWQADETNPDGGYYKNHTLSDQFKATLNITEVTTYTFKADGTALSNIWIEFATGLEFKIDGVIATGNANGTSITFAAGTYDIYLKRFSDSGNFCLWVEGTKTGEWGNGGDVETKTDGIYAGDTKVAALVVNTGNTDTGCTEYWFGGESVQFTQGDVLEIYIGGKKLTNLYGLQGVTGDASNASQPNTKLTITATGKYKVYLKLWANSGNYTVEFAKDADVGDVSDLPDESCRIVLTGSDSKTITIYLVDANGDPLTLSDYKMWAWGDAGNLLTDKWDDRPAAEANMTAPKALGDKISFKFTKGSSESNNLEGIATGKIYVVTVGANLQLTIQEYTGN